MESAAFAAMKIRAIIKLIEDGWYLDRTRGSHRQYKHDQKKGWLLLPEGPVTILPRARKIVWD
jgi:predicted RNA binding protein YcfA (HicA-like mRNA interferase family)